MHDPYNSICISDLNYFLPGTSKAEFISLEFDILITLEYSLFMRGGVILNAVHFSLLHYSKCNQLSDAKSSFLCSIGEKVIEQVLPQKLILASRNKDLITGIVLASIVLFNENGFMITATDLSWGKCAPLFLL